MTAKNTSFPTTFTLNIRGKLLVCDSPLVMGILNLTPDSFYDGGKLKTDAALLFQAEKMLSEGADILDIGGVSTRPGADEISTEEELQRVLPAIQLLKKNFPETVLSVDTYRATVAEKTLEAGADIINDISAGNFDTQMFSVVAKYRAPFIMMHIQGAPKTMQQQPHYENVVQEILQFFIEKIQQANEAGIPD